MRGQSQIRTEGKRSHCPLIGRSKNLALRGHANVRFGSLADIDAPSSHVRFTPQSGHQSDIAACPLCAKSGLMRRSNRPQPSLEIMVNFHQQLARATLVMGCAPTLKNQTDPQTTEMYVGLRLSKKQQIKNSASISPVAQPQRSGVLCAAPLTSGQHPRLDLLALRPAIASGQIETINVQFVLAGVTGLEGSPPPSFYLQAANDITFFHRRKRREFCTSLRSSTTKGFNKWKLGLRLGITMVLPVRCPQRLGVGADCDV
jgi:hypothetical protein